MKSFDEFFGAATGNAPYGHQRRLAQDGLPAMVRTPTGTGKTGIILAWLWRRLYADPDSTPRRLIYALPQRGPVDQVAAEAGKWLANLGLTDRVALHVAMGESQRQWRLDMHRPAIVVGTADALVSKALNRGYGIGRVSFPIDFALVTNGAHWVIDETRLCPESATTLRQLAAFARMFPTAEPFGLTCMSATGPLETADDAVRILPEERTRELAVRLEAARTIRRLDARPGDYEAIAATARDRHRPGTLTLVVLNTAEAAHAVYRALRAGPPGCTLLHSRFRGVERAGLMAAVTGGTADRIVVATQVVEAGLDLSAAVLVTEAAPWPSLVRRAGRCNRTGLVRDAELWWVPPAGPPSCEQADIEASSAELGGLDGRAVTGEDLLSRAVAVTEAQVAVLPEREFTALFDAAPDPNGADVDIALYVRDAEDLDAQLAWASWTAEAGTGAPPAEARAPGAEFRCQVPLAQVNTLARDVPVWRLDQVLGRWTRVSAQAGARPVANCMATLMRRYESSLVRRACTCPWPGEPDDIQFQQALFIYPIPAVPAGPAERRGPVRCGADPRRCLFLQRQASPPNNIDGASLLLQQQQWSIDAVWVGPKPSHWPQRIHKSHVHQRDFPSRARTGVSHDRGQFLAVFDENCP